MKRANFPSEISIYLWIQMARDSNASSLFLSEFGIYIYIRMFVNEYTKVYIYSGNQ